MSDRLRENYCDTVEIQWSAHLGQAQSVWLIWFVLFIWFIWFIRLVWFNQINKTNQLNETDQTNQIDQINLSASPMRLSC